VFGIDKTFKIIRGSVSLTSKCRLVRLTIMIYATLCCAWQVVIRRRLLLWIISFVCRTVFGRIFI